MLRSLDKELHHNSTNATLLLENQVSTLNRRDALVRWVSVGFCTACGALLAYTTRYFVNGDAVAYFDMADAFNRGLWPDVVNLHYSPGYAVLLGIVLKVSAVNPSNELCAAKALNLMCYVFSLFALETLLAQIKRDGEFSPGSQGHPLPWVAFRAVMYGLFLVISLIYIRIQVVSPDMLVFGFTLLTAAVLVWIKRDAESHLKFAVLGLVTGAGYLCKTLFFPMTAIFLALSTLYCTSIRRAFPRVMLATLVFLIVSAPLLMALSFRLGRFSFGESGNFNYTYFVSGKGTPNKLPERIWNRPPIDVYSGESLVATYPSGFDLSYWNEGVQPSFDPLTQVSVFFQNVVALADFSPWLYLAFLTWLCIQVRVASSFLTSLRPPSLTVLFGTIAAAGTGLFCLVYFEPRYVGPFVFLGLAAVLLWPRYTLDSGRVLRSVHVGAGLLVGLMITVVIASTWEQSVRSLYDGGAKQSHRSAFLEDLAVKDFLMHRGVSKGQLVAIAGAPSAGIYWARLSKVKAAASIADQNRFLSISPQDRQQALDVLRSRGFAAIVAVDQSFAELRREGWRHVPGTNNYFVRFLNEES